VVEVLQCGSKFVFGESDQPLNRFDESAVVCVSLISREGQADVVIDEGDGMLETLG
jgi:hypothetical protein